VQTGLMPEGLYPERVDTVRSFVLYILPVA